MYCCIKISSACGFTAHSCQGWRKESSQQVILSATSYTSSLTTVSYSAISCKPNIYTVSLLLCKMLTLIICMKIFQASHDLKPLLLFSSYLWIIVNFQNIDMRCTLINVRFIHLAGQWQSHFQYFKLHFSFILAWRFSIDYHGLYTRSVHSFSFLHNVTKGNRLTAEPLFCLIGKSEKIYSI